jgi:hypothetical protein
VSTVRKAKEYLKVKLKPNVKPKPKMKAKKLQKGSTSDKVPLSYIMHLTHMHAVAFCSV